MRQASLRPAPARSRSSPALAVAGRGLRQRRQQRQLVEQRPTSTGTSAARSRRTTRERGDDDHGRLEELHRAEDPRGDLRPGARGGRLQGQEGAQPRRREDRLKALEGGDIDGYPSTPGTALTSFFGVTADRPAEGRAAGLRAGQGGLRQEGPHRAAADAVHELQRGRREEGDGRQARAEEDLGPEGQGAGPDALRLARVPPAAGLPARPRAGLRAEVQEVRAGRHRLRHEVLKKGQADVSIVFTTDPQLKREGRGPARGRQGHVPALQLDVPRASRDGREGRGRTCRRRSSSSTRA